MAGDGEGAVDELRDGATGNGPDDGAGVSDVSMNAAQLWQAVLADLATRISRRAFDNWFGQTTLAGVEDDTAVISAPNAFSASTLQARYAPQVERALAEIVGRELRAFFTVGAVGADSELPASVAAPARPERPAPSARPSERPRPRAQRSAPVPGTLTNQQLALQPSAHGLNPRLTYDSYVVGSSNRLAHAASLAVADTPGRQFNPLFVHGGVGLGKTHLLHAIGHRALEINPDLTILYVTSETFTNDVINAIRQQKMEDFRARYRLIDILMIDDIQFIAGKESTQEEFFHTFNSLYQNGKQVVVSSDKPPRAIAALEERMRSRFAGGLVADVQTPDYEMRTAILRQKAEDSGVTLGADVIEYIAHKDQTNIRELEGALTKILMIAQLYKRPLNLQLAMEALTDASIAQRRARTTSADVVDAVVRYYNTTRKDLIGRQRTREIVAPRQVAMYLLREETDGSLVDIGRELGGRDHTTVLHGIEKIERSLETDTQLRSQIMAIRESLLTGSTS
jgi:chromosomal replication initiator protein